MELNWQEPSRPDRFLEATYPAYETPCGPAMATAVVKKVWSQFDYETWVHDPYLASVGATNYARFAYGTEGSADEAKAHCEDYGVECATKGLRDFDIRQLYRRAFPKMVRRYLDSQFDFYRIIDVDDVHFEAYAEVEEGGYEMYQVHVFWDMETGEFSSYYT